MELTFFVKQPGGLYERFDEKNIFQRAYGLNEIKGMLLKAVLKKSNALTDTATGRLCPKARGCFS